MAFAQRFFMADPKPNGVPAAPPVPPATNSEYFFSSRRARRQLGLFAAGAGFFAITTMITRRSLARRYKAMLPKYYQPNTRPNEVNGAVEALDALSIATINVFSVGMMMTGGLLYALDISSIDDMRRKVRGTIRPEETGTDKEAEEEIEKWFSTLLEKLGRKDMIEPKGAEKELKDEEKK
jgi:hypothetical protein